MADALTFNRLWVSDYNTSKRCRAKTFKSKQCTCSYRIINKLWWIIYELTEVIRDFKSLFWWNKYNNWAPPYASIFRPILTNLKYSITVTKSTISRDKQQQIIEIVHGLQSKWNLGNPLRGYLVGYPEWCSASPAIDRLSGEYMVWFKSHKKPKIISFKSAFEKNRNLEWY